MTRDEFVQLNVDNRMRNEGEAQFNAARVRAELKAAGRPDISIPGKNPAAFQSVYDNFAAGRITKDQAVNQMGALMGNEDVGVPPIIPYRDAYREEFEHYWDEKIAPKRVAP